MFGFRFDEDSDAEKFLRRITARVQITGVFGHPCERSR